MLAQRKPYEGSNVSSPVSPSGPTFMGYAEVAALLGVTEHWLRKQVREGRIPHTKLSDRVIRFTPADIEALTTAKRVEPTAKVEKKAAPTKRRRSA